MNENKMKKYTRLEKMLASAKGQTKEKVDAYEKELKLEERRGYPKGLK